MYPGRGKRSRFPNTRWSLVDRAAASDGKAREQAQAELLELYAPALKSFLSASRRAPPDLVDDLVHDFIADKILGGTLVQHADRTRGRFRNLLLKSLTNFVATKMKRKYAGRLRGNDVGLDLPPGGAVSELDVEQFNREWVKRVVDDALGLMEQDCRERGREDLWAVFRMRVAVPLLSEREPAGYGEIVEVLGIDTPRQAINLLATAKRCFRRHLRAAVGRYVPDDRIDGEIADLREIVAR